ncbi:hypothetical protein D3C73_1391110 [compost metagenome]
MAAMNCWTSVRLMDERSMRVTVSTCRAARRDPEMLSGVREGFRLNASSASSGSSSENEPITASSLEWK